MGIFGSKALDAKGRAATLRGALALLKNNTVPGPVSVRGLISQALKDSKYSDCAVGESNEISVSKEVLSSLGLNRDDLAALDTWAADKDRDALQKGLEGAIAYAQ
ncbi:hypothetical protein K8R03_03175 [Candidatus Kaiserbacteria bacterium]|nr:hypothetical protein [Candidatus Kaiserbacteria bacterium]